MSNLVPWEPLREMTCLRDAMNRLIEDSFLSSGRVTAQATGGYMPLDVYEKGDSIVLKATVPGIKPEDLDVTIAGDVLTIKGEIKHEENTQEMGEYLRRELQHGAFCRQLTLPGLVDPGKATATFENGILTLEMPKKEQLKPKTVKITANK